MVPLSQSLAPQCLQSSMVRQIGRFLAVMADGHSGTLVELVWASKRRRSIFKVDSCCMVDVPPLTTIRRATFSNESPITNFYESQQPAPHVLSSAPILRETEGNLRWSFCQQGKQKSRSAYRSAAKSGKSISGKATGEQIKTTELREDSNRTSNEHQSSSGVWPDPHRIDPNANSLEKKPGNHLRYFIG
jgi:hypothetical protein